MHVPKSGGTSFREGLKAALQPQRHVAFFDGAMSGAPPLSTPPTKEGVCHELAKMPEGDLITGHISLDTVRRRYPKARRFTLLRVPELRVLSHYLFWRSWPTTGLTYADDKQTIPLAQQPLETFLQEERLAFQLDNLAARMLLWPDPRIAQDRWIAPSDVPSLTKLALSRLAIFDHVDFLENPDLESDFTRWLGRKFTLPGMNETGALPEPLKSSLAHELTPTASARLLQLTAIDRVLWDAIARERVGGDRADALRTMTLMRGIARYSLLMGRTA